MLKYIMDKDQEGGKGGAFFLRYISGFLFLKRNERESELTNKLIKNRKEKKKLLHTYVPAFLIIIITFFPSQRVGRSRPEKIIVYDERGLAAEFWRR